MLDPCTRWRWGVSFRSPSCFTPVERTPQYSLNWRLSSQQSHPLKIWRQKYLLPFLGIEPHIVHCLAKQELTVFSVSNLLCNVLHFVHHMFKWRWPKAQFGSPVHVFPNHYLGNHFNIVLHFTPRSLKWYYYGFLQQNFVFIHMGRAYSTHGINAKCQKLYHYRCGTWKEDIN